MKEKTTTELPDTDYLRELANDDKVLVGNNYRDALKVAADHIDRLRAERDQWRRQALEEDAANNVNVGAK